MEGAAPRFRELGDDAQRLALFALDLLTTQIESKGRCESWGEFILTLEFKGGELKQVAVEDKVRVRASELGEIPSRSGTAKYSR